MTFTLIFAVLQYAGYKCPASKGVKATCYKIMKFYI